jgi:hypothetical protein
VAHQALADLGVLVTPQGEAGLEDEEVLEDQAALRRRREGVQRIDGRGRVRKVCQPQRIAP